MTAEEWCAQWIERNPEKHKKFLRRQALSKRPRNHNGQFMKTRRR